jgi:excisionase family DNA binding protein
VRNDHQDNLSQVWLTRRQAATYAQVCEATISKAVVRGLLAHVRIGNRRSLRFRHAWIDEWLNRGFRAAA